MMRRLLIFTLLLLGLLAVLVWQLPASHLLARLPAGMDEHVRVHRASGSIWNGQAEFSSPWLPSTQSLAWQCSPQSLSRIGCRLSGLLEGELHVERQGLALRELRGQGLKTVQPLQVILGGRPRASLDRLDLAVETLVYAPDRLLLTGQAQARALRLDTAVAGRTLSITGLRELSAECRPSGQESLCQLQSRDSEGRLSGEVRLQARRVSGSLDVNLPRLGAHQLNF